MLYDWTLLAVLISIASLSYASFIALQRLLFSSISHIPGPKLAALTFWYEGWYDVVKWGQYNNKLRQLHHMYGPIIRISPAEVHILDPDFFDDIYCLGRRVDKWSRQMGRFGSDLASFGTINHRLHQKRRAPLAAMFSKRAIAHLEPVLQQNIEKLITRLRAASGSGSVINLFYAFSALTGDIINQYAFGISQDSLDAPDFAPYWYDFIASFNRASFFLKHIGSPLTLVALLPQQLGDWLFLPAELAKTRSQLRSQLIHVREAKGGDRKQRTVFHEIFESDLPPADKTVTRLIDEAFSVTAAGMVTTADVLSVISYHIIKNKAILAQMQRELQKGNEYSLRHLEQLPYVTAVIKEGLRMTCGVTSRLARIFPDDDLHYHDFVIPAATPVSMSIQLVLYDPNVFPNPQSFHPDRWLGEGGRQLDKYLVCFSKGSRMCVGLNLAWAELYLTLAAVFRDSGLTLQLFDTTDADAEIVSDAFVPGFRPESKGIRVTVV